MKQTSCLRASLLAALALTLGGCAKDSAGPETSDLIPASTGDRWGFIDRTGKYVVNPQYEAVSPYSDELALVRKNGRLGFIDEAGDSVTAFVYQDATPFADGCAWTVLPNGAPTLIDTKGTIICTLTDAEQAYSLSDGLAKVTSATSDTVRYVDKAGKTVLTLTGFTWAGSFSEGLAPVVKDGKYGYVDKDGRVVIAPTYDTASDFTDGKAVVQLNDKYGVVDTEGRSVIAPQFDGMTPDGTRGYVVEVADRYGYCDPEGRLTVNPQFDWLSPAGDGELMLACQNELYGYVDREGQWVINPQYPSAQPFSQGQAIASAANGTMGLIDKTGAWGVAPQFDRMLFPVADRPAGAFVVSDYFDVEGTAAAVLAFFEGGTVDGLPVKDCPLARFTAQYELDSTSTRAERILTPTLGVRVEAEGDFYAEVSDGWWGTVQRHDAQRPIGSFTVTFALTGRGMGKGRSVYDAVLKTLKSDTGTIGADLHYVLRATDGYMTFTVSSESIPVGMNETTGFAESTYE